MASSKYDPRAEHEKMNHPVEEDQIVDLSVSDDEMIDEPSQEQPVYSSVTENQVFEQTRAGHQVIDQRAIPRQVEVPRMKQPEFSRGQGFSGLPCPDCGWLMPPNSSFCPHCGLQLISSKSRATLPPHIATSSAHGTPVKRPNKGRKNRWKPIWIGLMVIVAFSLIFGVYNQDWGKLAMIITGSRTQQTAPATSTPQPTSIPLTPTVSMRATPTRPQTITSGALILLNPGVVRQGVSMGVTGSGFDPKAGIDLFIKQRQSDNGQPIGLAQTDRYGNFYANLNVPQTLSSGTFFVEARERGGNKVAQAAGVVAGGAPQLKLSEQVGKPGDMITATLHGFSPGETVKVYWNTMVGQPFTTLQTDGGGGIGQATIQVPFGAAGINTFLFVGAKSLSMVAAAFDLLSLYPSIKLSNYALRADHQLSFTGTGFGPGERVLVYLNNTNGQPLAVIQTTQHGTFANAGTIDIPFALKGRQTFIFLGEESRASVAVSWTVLPYMPNAQASTYGGLPGMTVTFYASGFARNEIVHVYVGGTHDSNGTLVSCFRTDDKGNAASAGSYIIPGNAQGKLTFKLIGVESDGTTTATMSIQTPPSPVQVPPQPAFTCPLDNAT